MKIQQILETYQDLNQRHLVLRTEPDDPQALRLIDRNTRQLLGIVRSPADFTRLMTNKLVPGRSIIVTVPPSVYKDNQSVIDAIQKFSVQISRIQDREIRFDLQQSGVQS